MKSILTFFLLSIFVLFSTENLYCQDNGIYADKILEFEKSHPSTKELKKAFRIMRRKAPSGLEKRMVRRMEKEYFSLLEEDKRLWDSIQEQKAKISQLLEEVEAGKMSEADLEKLHAENDSLSLIMRAYVRQIDSLNTLNKNLKNSISLKDFYFKLENFIEPKIYFYYNQSDPTHSQYWKLSSVPDSNFLITETYSSDFEQVKFFKEQYDSIGSKVIECAMIDGLDSTFSTIGSADLYHWTPKEPIACSVNFLTSYYDGGYTKVREFGSVASMDILGNTLEVLRFHDGYTFYMDGEVTSSRMQQSFYAKEIGMVRFLRFDEVEKTNVTYILKAIYTEQEWNDLREKR